jgi:hypothetical protein
VVAAAELHVRAAACGAVVEDAPAEISAGRSIRTGQARLHLTDNTTIAGLANGPRAASVIQEQIWLLGQPPLVDYLDYVKRVVEGGEAIDRRSLVDSWRTANDYYGELESSEAGIADEAECLELPDTVAPLADELAQTPSFLRTFDRMPTHFGMVELGKIVVSQRRVTLPFVQALQARLDPLPDLQGLFHFCQPLERRDPPVRIRRLGTDRFVFMSDSNDLRFLDTALLRADQITAYDSVGPIGGVVGLVVGYGSNFLSVIRYDKRMVLHNGYHRACALLAAGITHAPAVIQTVTRRDELEVAAAQTVVDDPAFYFKAARPPLLKDFFDPGIRTLLRARRLETMVEVRFEIKEHSVSQM